MADGLTINAASAGNVAAALKSAARRTGVDFGYLYKVAVRESGLNAGAEARTSSAAGLFQFVEQTWLETVKKYGADHGLSAEAAAIRPSGNGRFDVPDAARREAILNLRFDPDKASALAGELANQNRRALEGRLGRSVDATELYAAHFLGAGGAAKLLKAPSSANAAQLLPAAAEANAPVFYDGDRARTVREVVSSFRRSIEGEGGGKPAAGRAEIAPPTVNAAAARNFSASELSRGQASTNSHRASFAADLAAPRAAAGRPATTPPRPFLREGPSLPPTQPRTDAFAAAAETAKARIDRAAFSPLALVVLQALDPSAIERERTRDSARPSSAQ